MASDNLQPTEAQLVKDEAFVEATRAAFVAPLVEELAAAVDGFEGMSLQDRFVAVLALNEPHVGVGDSLMLDVLPVYAGRELGNPRRAMASDGVVVERYVPRFSSDMSAALLAPAGMGDVGAFLQQERDLYDELPVSYRAALLALYVRKSLLVEPHEATAFVLGCCDPTPRRFMAAHVRDGAGEVAGWLVRVRDNRPPQLFAIDLANRLRNAHDEVEALTWEVDEAFGVRPYESLVNRRSSPAKTALAYAYVDALLASGVKVGRGGDLTWEQVAGKLSAKYGDRVHNYSGGDLRDGYRKYKQRRGEW